MAGADEAGQTPQAPDHTQHTAEQGKPADGSDPRLEQAQQATAPAPGQAAAAETDQAQADAEQPPEKPGFGERGRMRRRARFLRKARELAYRDLGGLVFDLHRFGQRNDPLVLAKLAMLREIDRELRGLEQALRDRRSVTVLREVGIAVCPRCAALHGGDDRFCPGCGLAFDTHADRPISTAPMAAQPQAPATSPQPMASTPASALTSQPSTQPPNASPPVTAPASAIKPFASPAAQPAPAVKPTAAPVPARSAPPSRAVPSPSAPEPDRPRPADEEQTQVLRPPARDK